VVGEEEVDVAVAVGEAVGGGGGVVVEEGVDVVDARSVRLSLKPIRKRKQEQTKNIFRQLFSLTTRQMTHHAHKLHGNKL